MHEVEYNEIKDASRLLKTCSTSAKSNQKLSKAELLDLLIRFIIKDNIPVSKVESPHLKRLIEGNSHTNL